MELVVKYFLVISGSFDRTPMVFDVKPTEKEIIEAIKINDGESARVEKRYVLKS